jgi:diguanylate cyclase (GGDEF)-like protein/PAS domain S-box-containing protein
VSAGGLIQLANPASERLLAPAGGRVLVGDNFSEFVAPEERPRLDATLSQALCGQRPAAQLEITLVRSDGERFPAEVACGHFPCADPAVQVLVRDITQRKRAEADLRLAARVIASTAEGIVITDARANIVSVNQAFTAITGFTAEVVLGRPFPFLVRDAVGTEPYRQMATAIRRTGQWQGEVWSRRQSGDLYPAWLNVGAVRDERGRVTHYVGIFSDSTARKQTEERLRVLAYHDTLTGLPNRALFQNLLQRALAKAQRNQRSAAILFVDLDRFKNVNDTLGHAAGDQLLKDAAVRLRANLRESDTIARLGGDEFAVMLEEVGHHVDVATVAQKLLGALAAPYAVLGQQVYCTGSIGISVFPNDGAALDELLKHADAALYRAKEQGRNAYMFYTADMYAAAMRRLELENSLRLALERDEFQVFFQPRVALATGQVQGMEALLRWQHPEFGLVSPGHFIDLAEETGLIVPIGEWVLRAAAIQARAWQLAGFPRLRLSVNVSGRQFKQANIVEAVAGALQQSGLAADDLELELTESILLPGAAEAVAKLEQLRAMGVHLSIDDFGTGYSSLDYLKRLPVNRLKIDRSFVRGIATQIDDGAIVRAIIDMAHDLKLKVTAEGVETAEQLGFLQAYHCDEIQGFYFGPPAPPDEFVKFLL